MGLFRSRTAVPAVLTAAFGPDEHLIAGARSGGSELLAATRYGLWRVRGDQAQRMDWHLISKARLAAGVLHLTVARLVGRWADGTVLLADDPERAIPLDHSAKLTDVVHDRVRRSVVASRHLEWSGAGGWVVLRRVPGRDGLTVQLRLDPGADAQALGFAAAVAVTVDEIWPDSIVRTPPSER